nr:MAG: hypothetical protein [Porcellio scaber clopovirus]
MNSLILKTIIAYNDLINYSSEFFNYSLINYGIVLTLYRSLFLNNDNEDDHHHHVHDQNPKFFGIDLSNLKQFSEALYEITRRAFRDTSLIFITNKNGPSTKSSSSSGRRVPVVYDSMDMYYINAFYRLNSISNNNIATRSVTCQEDAVKKILLDYLVKEGEELHILFLIIKELKEKVTFIQNLYSSHFTTYSYRLEC